MRSGHPRVSSAGPSPFATMPEFSAPPSPYDTSEAVREVLARIEPPGAPPGPPATDLEPGSVVLPRRLIDKYSGFIDDMIERHRTGRGAIIPPHVKDPSATEYGVPTRESTITWGSTADMSFEQGGAIEPVFPIRSIQLLHVNRPRPVVGSILTVIQLGGNWSGENQTTFTITYQLGVGQGHITIPRIFVLTGAQLANASNTTPIVDLVAWPLQSLQVGVSYSLSPNNNGVHGVLAGSFFAPTVQ